MTRRAKNLFLYAFIVAIPVGAPSVMLIRRASRPSQTVSSSPNGATNAAFRDGLYQGKLAAERGGERRPSSGRGRWNNDQDRASFISGYEQGYRQALAAKRQQSH